MSPKRIEFIAPMGAGKTSIFNEMRFQNKDALRSARQEKKRIILNEAFKASPVHYIVTAALTLNQRLAQVLINDKITSSAWRATEHRRSEWNEFIGCALDHLNYSSVPCDDRLIRIKWFIRELTDVALFLDQSPSDAILVHDESLLQRGVGFGLGREVPEQFCVAYFNTVPLPDLVVHVDLPDAELLRARIDQRAGDGKRFIEHLDTAIEMSRLGARIMRDRGVKVVECDGGAEISHSASKVASAVCDLQRERV